MAKAVFQRNQKVWVESVGAWSVVERIVPIWARGFEEPVRVTYDVGLGREFHAHELKAEQEGADVLADDGTSWRLMRARNKWQTSEECHHHPYPGSYPVVVTDANDWGGWRVPGAEYDLDPNRVERQAEIIVRAPIFMKLLEEFVEYADQEPENLSEDLTKLAQIARRIISEVSQ